ncbi:MAG: phenylalanine--tRNA ligase subunit alpha [Acidobacteriota bacterium]
MLNELEEKISKIKTEFEKKLKIIKSEKDLSELKDLLLSRKRGEISLLLKKIPELSEKERPFAGKLLNELRNSVEQEIKKAHQKILEEIEAEKKIEYFDITLPGRPFYTGSPHLIRLIEEEIEEIFLRMGYSIEEGPEIESDWYNFEALNIPKDHPARDQQDTFYIDDEVLLRTHTSPVQIRVMEKRKPPIKSIMPGRVFRKDEADASHSPMFFQVEGLVIDKGINFAHLKGTLEILIKTLFSKNTELRFRPSYFPFTEPSAEVDMRCPLCKEMDKECRLCGGTGWIEILGAGMVHPKVLETCGIEWEVYTGFAFGLGVERIAMIKLGVPDMRYFYENDLRFIKQFER